MRYLTIQQFQTNLSLGKSIEQWLSYEDKIDYTILKWLRIDKEKDSTYSVSCIESFDDGGDDYIDIYSFSPINPDEPYIIDNFKSIYEAVKFAIDAYSASDSKFVSAGMIQEEYNYLDRRSGS